MRHDAERVGAGTGDDRNDVEDVRAQPELRARGLGLLHANGVAEETQLIDQVLARAAVRVRTGGPAADRAGELVDVRAGVLRGEARVGRAGRQPSPPTDKVRDGRDMRGQMRHALGVTSAMPEYPRRG